MDQRAVELGLTRLIVGGAPYRHVLYYRPGADSVADASGLMRVYIDHDGTPWRSRSEVSMDPTPRDALALDLLASDPGPAVYLGRPCYFGLAIDPPCTPLAWTHRRYSEAVVTSMAAALQAFLGPRTDRKLALVGYSGGGTVATLLAERLPQTVAVITLAANLDVTRWAQHHGYSPLEGSLDPARRPDLPASIVQRHYAGGRDANVPAALLRAYAAARPAAAMIEIADFDHVCCWREQWPRILRDLAPQLREALTR